MVADDRKDAAIDGNLLSTLRIIAQSDHTRTPRAAGGGKAANTAHSAHANILDQSNLFDSDDDDDDSFADDNEVEETANTEEMEADIVAEAPRRHRSRESSPVRSSGRGRGSSPVRRSKTKGSRSNSPARRSKKGGDDHDDDTAQAGQLSEHLSRSGSPNSARPSTERATEATSGSPTSSIGREGSSQVRRSGRDRSKSPIRHQGRLRESNRLRKSESPGGSPVGSPRERPRRSTTRERSPMRRSEGTARSRSPARKGADLTSSQHRSCHSHRSSPSSTPGRVRSSYRSPVRSSAIEKIYAESANVQKARREAFMKLCEKDGVTDAADPIAAGTLSTERKPAHFRRDDDYSPDRGTRKSREGSPVMDAVRHSKTDALHHHHVHIKNHVMGIKPSDDPLAVDYDKQLEATIGFKPKDECWEMMKGGLNF